MTKYILFFTLIILLASCSASDSRSPTTSGGSYADQLRARASGANGQPGAQQYTTLVPSPTPLPPPPQTRQVVAMPTPQVLVTAAPAVPVGAIEQIGSDSWANDATISLIAFITSTPAMLGFAVLIAGIAIRRNRK